ncbi:MULTISPECIES: hypothetical protein [Allobacillus]|uniref:Flagellar hook-length control protein-like C-terminal domain-containing protein n=1 Tax=Allobacillus salarius TaxID=1955272 RepID=A0A556PRX5_9BACI|nr:hypothetical protein [Allobacillus salarius]TSJ67133.1 hypothetical protein FPQ13_02445 [Allobacillus salarius]
MMQPNPINQLFQSIRLSRTDSSKLTVRTGQILPARVIKFLPENRALMQMSGKQIVGQIDTELHVNQRYLMQVMETSPAIKMKVLSQKPANEPAERINVLMQTLGLKLTKADQALLHELMKQQIPLSKESLGQLFALGKNDALSTRSTILSEMLLRNMPLTEQVYQSLSKRLNQPISINQAIQQLESQMMANKQQTLNQIQLASSLQLFQSERSSNQILHTFMFQALKEVGRGSQTTFQLFKKAGVIPSQTSYAEWSAHIRSWATSQSIRFQPSGNQLLNGQTQPFPFSMTGEKISASIQQLASQQLGNSSKSLQTVVDILQSIRNNGAITKEQVRVVNNLLQGTFLANLKKQLPMQQNTLDQLTNSIQQQSTDVAGFLRTTNGTQLLNSLTHLLDLQADGEQSRALLFFRGMTQLSSVNATTVMAKLSSFMELTQVESGKGKSSDFPSILSQLQQVQSQTSSTSFQAAAQQIQQTLQAMHLSMEANRDFIQFSAQLPKEMLGLNEDLWMDFEGKKQADGTIHPEQCRIMFYLDLPHLSNIIIDMQVINRMVDVTIYHQDPKSIRSIVHHYEQDLRNGLEGIDYQFTGLHLKKLQRKSKELPADVFSPSPLKQGEGIDFKA